MANAVTRGRFAWHELMTTDPDAAIRFYSQVVGWGIEQFPGMPDYRMWTSGGRQRGGVMRQSEEERRRGLAPHWLMYVAVPEIDATIRQAEGLDGRVRIPTQHVPGVGRYAILADPQGIVFGLFTPEGTPRRESGDAEIGDFSWHELAAPDPNAAWSFYQTLFGWEKADAMDMGPNGTYQMFRRGGGIDLGAFYRRPADKPGYAEWLMYVLVRDADRAAATVTRLGGRVQSGPMDIPGGGRIATCVDPQGAAFAVHSAAAVPQKAKAVKKKSEKKKSVKKKGVKKRIVKKKAARKRKR